MSFFAIVRYFIPYGETIALLSDQKRGKSHQRKASRPPLQTTSHPAELAAGSNAPQVNTYIQQIEKLLSISPRIIRHTARANKVSRKKRADSTGWVCHAQLLIHFHCMLNSDYASMT